MKKEWWHHRLAVRAETASSRSFSHGLSSRFTCTGGVYNRSEVDFYLGGTP